MNLLLGKIIPFSKNVSSITGYNRCHSQVVNNIKIDMIEVPYLHIRRVLLYSIANSILPRVYQLVRADKHR